MLNQILYDALKKHFGRVVVANKGQHPRVIKVASPFSTPNEPTTNRTRTKVKEGEFYRVNCPFCGDTKSRLWINCLYGQPTDTGGVAKHLAWCYNETECMRERDNRISLYNTINGINHAIVKPVTFTPKVSMDDPIVEVDPPGPVIKLKDLPEKHKARAYLSKRGYDIAELSDVFDIGYCTAVNSEDHYLMQDRIYIPLYFHGKLVGWQGRYAGDIDWKNARIPKFYIRPGTPKSRIFYNYDQAAKFDWLVAVEGATDALNIGPRAIGYMQAIPAYDQRRLLEKENEGKLIVFVPDPPMYDDVKVVADELKNPTEVIKLPDDKDPGSMDSLELCQQILEVVNRVNTEA